MSIVGAITGLVRGVLIAAATGAAAFGLLVVFHPFDATPSAPSSAATALHQRIEELRSTIARSEAGASTQPGETVQSATSPAAPAADAQIAAAAERRDLALRHAQAIRDALAAGTDLTALAEIRDSVVIGQLLAQRAALDGQIADDGARFRPNHPTMRALTAQRRALDTQIRAEATGIATALEAEAKIDDAQVKQLGASLASSAPTVAIAGTPPPTSLAAQRAELDSLMETYLNLGPGSPAASPPDILAPTNLLVVIVAFAAALVFQFGLLLHRRRLRQEADLALWQAVADPDISAPPQRAPANPRAATPPLRRAS